MPLPASPPTNSILRTSMSSSNGSSSINTSFLSPHTLASTSPLPEPSSITFTETCAMFELLLCPVDSQAFNNCPEEKKEQRTRLAFLAGKGQQARLCPRQNPQEGGQYPVTRFTPWMREPINYSDSSSLSATSLLKKHVICLLWKLFLASLWKKGTHMPTIYSKASKQPRWNVG